MLTGMYKKVVFPSCGKVCGECGKVRVINSILSVSHSEFGGEKIEYFCVKIGELWLCFVLCRYGKL